MNQSVDLNHADLDYDTALDIFEGACTKKQCIGMESELFLFDKHGKRLRFDSTQGPNLTTFLTSFKKWNTKNPHDRFLEDIAEDYEGQRVTLGLKNQRGATLSLEPGGQFEFSSAPAETLHTLARDIDTFREALECVCEAYEITSLFQGYDTQSDINEVGLIPKRRYDLMYAYMPQVGTLGRLMMKMTCTVQFNLDYASELDMAKKMRVAMALQPLVACFMASSSYQHYHSYRAHIWQNTDPGRSGLLPFVFKKMPTFLDYIKYVLSTPLYFIKREGLLKDALGRTFLKEATVKHDFKDHMTTVFPEVRLHPHMELRSADSVPLEQQLGLAALWIGLLYDDHNLETLFDLVSSWKYEDIESFYRGVSTWHQENDFQGQTVTFWFEYLKKCAHEGLVRRCFYNADHQDESIYLKDLP